MSMVHEFGIIREDPLPGVRYDEYEPLKYGCIAVRDEIVERFDDKLSDMPCYWHTLDRPEKGLAYCGITLIPPGSLPRLAVMAEKSEPLRELIAEAAAENRFVIHFGL